MNYLYQVLDIEYNNLSNQIKFIIFHENIKVNINYFNFLV